LLDTDLYDAWLIEWSPSSGLELHDHGGSRGVVVVVDGTLVETYTEFDHRPESFLTSLHTTQGDLAGLER
jgi:hypothetical protein